MKPHDYFRRVAFTVTLCAIFILPASSVGARQTPPPSQNCRDFLDTGKDVCGIFLRYWNEHGGLAQQGLPISTQMSEVSDTNGKTYIVQYFERSVLEHHPEYAGSPYEVSLSLLGSMFYKERYPRGAPGQQPNNSTGSILVPQTGKRLGGRFLQYWQSRGGLPQQGYPISDEFEERSELNGKTYRVQYFERAVFEFHPENAAPNDILLSQLGTYRNLARYGGREQNLWSALVKRPLSIPVTEPSAACPVSRGKKVDPQFGQAFGEGPVYPVLGAQGVAEISLSGSTLDKGFYLVKTLWVAPPDFYGPVLIRGGQLDGRGEVRFGPIGMEPQSSLELGTGDGLPVATRPAWIDWPRSTRVRGPGCYAFQIDGVTFSKSVVFRVTE